MMYKTHSSGSVRSSSQAKVAKASKAYIKNSFTRSDTKLGSRASNKSYSQTQNQSRVSKHESPYGLPQNQPLDKSKLDQSNESGSVTGGTSRLSETNLMILQQQQRTLKNNYATALNANDYSYPQQSYGKAERRTKSNKYATVEHRRPLNSSYSMHSSVDKKGEMSLNDSVRSSRHSRLSVAASRQSQEKLTHHRMCQYGVHSCNQQCFRRDLCREHFCVYTRNLLRNTLQSLYQAPEKAFGAIDFSGTGYITL